METIIAISILMVGVLGPMALARQNIIAAREAEDRLSATFLAQEGIEAVRNVIANNSADGDDWLTGVSSACDTPSGCVVDVTADVSVDHRGILLACGACSKQIFRNDTNGVFRQSNVWIGSGWTASKFSRGVTVTTLESGKRVMASTTVSWGRGSVTLQEDIYNWFFELD